MANKICVVTGGSSGYGKAIATLLAKQNETVVLVARREEPLKKARDEIGERACFCTADITKYSDWMTVKEYVRQNFGRIDLLVNNVGAAIAIKTLAEQTPEQLTECINVNLTGTILGCKAFVDMFMEQKQGSIINISSVCGEHAWPKFPAYTAAKFGVQGLSKALYTELRPYHVRVSCIAPASSDTNFRTNAGLERAERAMQPEDFAHAVVDIFNLPQHITVEHATVWGMDQECVPL